LLKQFIGPHTDAASGNTIDFAYYNASIPQTFLPELRGNNFIVEPSQIQPSFEEIWAGLVEIFEHY
jgi:carboxypeptidase A2